MTDTTSHTSSIEFITCPRGRESVYGVYPWWPEDGEDWIHPEDREIVRTLLPGPRVFRREPKMRGRLYELSYGDVKFRVRPTLWLTVPGEGFEVGDRVEIKSMLGENPPDVAVIQEMFWSSREKVIHYLVELHEMVNERRFRAKDLRPV